MSGEYNPLSPAPCPFPVETDLHKTGSENGRKIKLPLPFLGGARQGKERGVPSKIRSIIALLTHFLSQANQ